MTDARNGQAAGRHRSVEVRPERRRAMARADAVMVVLVILSAVVATSLYVLVDRLSVVATGVEQAGTSVREGFDRASGTVDGLPVVGDRLSQALEGAAENTGGRAEELGAEARQRIRRTAIAVGLTSFLVPTAVVLGVALPRRSAERRSLAAAVELLADADDPERRRLIAWRAVAAAPPQVLARHTSDPLGDLVSGRFDPLVAAVFDDLGVRPAAGSSGHRSTGTSRAGRAPHDQGEAAPPDVTVP